MRKYLLAIVCMAFYFVVTGQSSSADLINKVVRVKFQKNHQLQLNNQQNSFQATGTYLSVGNVGLDQVNQRFSAQQMRRVFPYAGKFESKHQAYGLDLWYDIRVDAETSIEELMAAYGAIEVVAAVEPIQVYSTGAEDAVQSTNDPRLDEQWHYENTGQTGGLISADISLFDAWQTEAGDARVIVSVHDSGIDLYHPDLQNRIWTNNGEIPGDNIDNDNNGYVDDYYGYNFAAAVAGGDPSSVMDYNGHGTHTSGTIAAENNNGIGVSGVAGGTSASDGVRIMMMRLGDDYGSNSIYNPAPSYIYAADMGSVISSNSWGGGSYDGSVYDAIQYYISEAGGRDSGLEGGLVIFSSGNSSSTSFDYKADIDGVIMVSATNHLDRKSWYSNYGSWVDISAPGGETDISNQGVLSTLPGNSYGFFQGTSMACPHVSGVAALLVSKAFGSGLTRQGLAEALLSTTDDIYDLNLGYTGLLGTGRLNASRALDAVGTGSAGPGSVQIDPASVSRELTIGETSEVVVRLVNTSEFDLTVKIATPEVSWISVDRPSVTIAANTTAKVPVTLSAADVGGGNSSFLTFSYPSVSSLQTYRLPISVYTLDQPELTSVDTVFFSDLYPGQQELLSFSIQNSGTGYIELLEANMASDQYSFTFDPLTLAPGAFQSFEVAFSPQTSGSWVDSILFQTDHEAITHHKVVLVGKGKSTLPPVLNVNTTTIDIDEDDPLSGQVFFTITNDGEDLLNYLVSAESAQVFDPLEDQSVDAKSESEKDEVSSIGSYKTSVDSPVEEVMDLAWDGSHLWVADQNSNLILKYDLSSETVLDTIESVAIQSVAIAADEAFLYEQDAYEGRIVKYNLTTGGIDYLNLQSRYYDNNIGVDQSGLWIQSNYTMYQFDKDSGEELLSYSISRSSTDPAFSIVANSLYIKQSSYLYVYEKESYSHKNRLYQVAGQEVSNTDGLSFDGEKMWTAMNQYGKLVAFDIYEDFTYMYNYPIGYLAAGETATIPIFYDLYGLDQGNRYTDRWMISSNAITDSNATVEINATIAGESRMELSNTITIDAYVDHLYEDSLQISNTGSGILEIDMINAFDDRFEIENKAYSVAAYSSIKVPFSLLLTEEGSFRTSLAIGTNDPVEPSLLVEVHVIGLLAPEISVDLDQIVMTLYESQVDSVAINVENSGLGSLFYSFLNDPHSTEVVVESTSETYMGTAQTTKSKEELDLLEIKGLPYSSQAIDRLMAAGTRNTDLEDVLSALDESYTEINSLIPNRYDFTNGETGSSISDGGGDMYDTGNRLYTSIGGPIGYTNGEILTSYYLQDENYFTAKYPGLFVFAADYSDLETFGINGGLGADGSGSVDGAVLSYRVGSKEYLGFVKRVYSTSDPSVNHLIIVENNGSVYHSFDTYSDSDEHTVYELSGTSRLYYLLFASASGGYVDNDDMSSIMERFIETVESDGSYELEPSLSEVNTIPFDTYGLDFGEYDYNVQVLSNDPDLPVIDIPTNLTVLPSARFESNNDTLSFENVAVGSTGHAYLFFTNIGSEDLILDEVTVSSSAGFEVVSFTDTVGFQQYGVIEVVYTPTEIEELEAMLSISTNDKTHAVYEIAVKASGVASAILEFEETYVIDTIAVGEKKDRSVTLSNLGTDALSYRLVVEEAVPYRYLAAGIESYRIQSGVYEGGLKAPAQTTNNGKTIAAHTVTPEELAGGFQSLGGKSVLVISSDYSSAVESVVDYLIASESFGYVGYVNSNYGFYFDIDDMKQYDAVLLYDKNGHQNADVLGDVLADYVDLGGGVVSALYESSNRSMGGRWRDEIETYSVYSNQNLQVLWNYDNISMGTVHLPDHLLMNGVNTFNGGISSVRYNATVDDLQPDVDLVASWSDGTPLIVAKELPHARLVDLGFYPVSDSYGGYNWDSSTDGVQIVVNALNYVAGGIAHSNVDWLELSSYSMENLEGGATNEITATISSDETEESLKSARITAYSGDSRVVTRTMQLDVFSDGVSDLVAVDTLDFGSVTIGYTADAMLRILNQGSGATYYYLAGDSLGNFETTYYDSLLTGGFETTGRLIQFTGDEIGHYFETITIKNVTDVQNREVVLSAEVVPPGVIRLNPDSVSLFANYQGQVASSFYIHNEGEADLAFQFGTFHTQHLTQNFKAEEHTPLSFSAIPTKGQVDSRVGYPVSQGIGVDIFGYAFMDSDEDEGPDYLWQDITTTGVEVDLEDDASVMINLPFEFPFYGLRKSSISIGANGVLSFDDHVNNPVNAQIPSGASPNGLIAAFWKDLSPNLGGSIYYVLTDDHLTVQFDAVPDYEQTGVFTFQIQLFASGEIVFYYEEMQGTTENVTVGIEDESGARGLQVAFNTDYVRDGLAVRFVHPQQRIDPALTSGLVQPGDSLEIPFVYHVMDDLGGYYTDYLTVSSNDTINPVSQLKISYFVDAPSSIAVYSDTLMMDTTFLTQVNQRSVWFENDSLGILTVDSIRSASTQFELLFPYYEATSLALNNEVSYRSSTKRLTVNITDIEEVLRAKLVRKKDGVTTEVTDLAFTWEEGNLVISQLLIMSDENQWQLGQGELYLELFSIAHLDGLASYQLLPAPTSVDPYDYSDQFKLLYKPTRIDVDTTMITVYNNSANAPVYQFVAIGNGRASAAQISVSVTELAQVLVVNDSIDQTFRVSNTGSDSLSLSFQSASVSFESNLNPIRLNSINEIASEGESKDNPWIAPYREPTSSDQVSSRMMDESSIGTTFYGSIVTYTDFNLLGYSTTNHPEDFNEIISAGYNTTLAAEFVYGSSTQMYVLDYVGRLSLVDVIEETSYTIFQFPSVGSWTGLTKDPVTGSLYASTETGLYLVDPVTFSTEYVGYFGTSNMIGIAMGESGQMYGYTLEDNLYEIDVRTGAASLVGYIGFDAVFGQDLAYDFKTKAFYMAAYSNANGAELRMVDTNTGMTQSLGALATSYAGTQMTALAFESGVSSSVFSITQQDTVLAPGQNIEVSIEFNSSNLNNGVYTSDLWVNSSDQSNPSVQIPLALTVTGNNAQVGDYIDKLNFGLSTIYDTTYVELQVQNIGKDVLILDLDERVSGFMLVDDANDSVRIGIEETKIIPIQFVPTEPTTYTGEMTWSTNDPDMPVLTVGLSGAGQRSSVELNMDVFSFAFESHRGEELSATYQLSSVGNDTVMYQLIPEDGVTWMRMVKDSSYLQADSTASYDLAISTMDMEIGEYSSYFTLLSNDPYYDSLVVPVALVVYNQEPVHEEALEARLIAIGEDTVSVDLGTYFSDADEDVLSYEVATVGYLNRTLEDGLLTLWGTQFGQGQLQITVTDGQGGKVQTAIDLVANTRPIITKTIGEIYVSMDGEFKESLSLGDYFTDADGHDLMMTVDSSAVAQFVLTDDNDLFIKGTAEGVDTVALVAQDGWHEVSQSFRLVVEKEDMRLYPNPTKEFFQVNFPIELKDELALRLIDLSGNIVKEWTVMPDGDNVFELDIAEVRAGVYLLEMYDGDNRVSQERIVKI
ncbi:Serine protease, subtilisin family [Reichenbachiella agariperforans]|uniref:Serine protease, subtilisin family n=1 Tax=Reichenbachiella agariperforans TaxID=156994 RepID=A0A1M6J4V6_REIAG|nr:S8 family serine peptidase [Reichenbachiella agariperforans]SHJ41679.1 Serine protease, subtilisin family [Reichenbachiella agariperforans]